MYPSKEILCIAKQLYSFLTPKVAYYTEFSHLLFTYQYISKTIKYVRVHRRLTHPFEKLYEITSVPYKITFKCNMEEQTGENIQDIFENNNNKGKVCLSHCLHVQVYSKIVKELNINA